MLYTAVGSRRGHLFLYQRQKSQQAGSLFPGFRRLLCVSQCQSGLFLLGDNSQHASEARRFVRYLLSPEGQTILADANTGKYPVTPLAPGNPRAAQQAMLMNQPPLNYRLILKRQRLVQRMFDTAISFRLAQLKDAWRALHSAEVRLKRPLPEIRALLTRVPVDPASSEDEAWLAQFDNKSFAEQQMMEWQLWFLNNQRQAITKLEELK